MPNAYIHVRKTYSQAEEVAIMQAVQAALVAAFGVGPTDTNIIFMVHPSHRFMCPPDRDDPERYTNITVVGHASRTVEAKRHFYTAVVDNLEALGIPRNCSLIQLHELPPEDIAIRGGHPMRDFPAAMEPSRTAPVSVDEYIQGFSPDVQTILQRVRQVVRDAAPLAQEVISYRMPALKQNGVLVYFAAFKNHIGLYPPITGDARIQKAIAPYAGEKGNLRFPLDKPIPYDLISRITALRVKQDAAKAESRRRKVK